MNTDLNEAIKIAMDNYNYDKVKQLGMARLKESRGYYYGKIREWAKSCKIPLNSDTKIRIVFYHSVQLRPSEEYIFEMKRKTIIIETEGRDNFHKLSRQYLQAAFDKIRRMEIISITGDKVPSEKEIELM